MAPPLNGIQPTDPVRSRLLRRMGKSLLPLLAVALAACASGTTAELHSQRLVTAEQAPKRLLIPVKLGLAFDREGRNGRPFDTLRGRMVQTFAACGIVADVREIDEVSIENPIAKAMKEFNPDSILTVQYTSQSTAAGDFVSSYFAATLLDIASKKTIWKGNMALFRGDDRSDDIRINLFISSLVNGMKTDAVIPPACSGPAK